MEERIKIDKIDKPQNTPRIEVIKSKSKKDPDRPKIAKERMLAHRQEHKKMMEEQQAKIEEKKKREMEEFDKMVKKWKKEQKQQKQQK